MEIQNEIKNNADDMRDVIVSVEHLRHILMQENLGQKAGCKGC